MNSKSVKWTAPNTPGVTIPSKGFAAFYMSVPELTGHYIVGASIIGAQDPEYMAQVAVSGITKLLNDARIYVKLYNSYGMELTSVYQLIIWYV